MPLLILACALTCGLTDARPAMGRGRVAPSLRRTSSAPAPPAGRAKKPEAPALPTPHVARWPQGHLPPGGALVAGAVVHTVRAGETWQSIAEAYVDLTTTYDPAVLARAIVTENLPASKRGVTPGMRLTIPDVASSAPKSGAAQRLRLPADHILKGVYVRGVTAGGRGYPALLDRAARHGMNAIVLDVKDYDGLLTYPSKVPLADESGATRKAPIRSLARAISFAHQRGIRVIARVSCFNDQLMAKAHPGMAIRGVSGHPYRNGWLDPKSERAQGYAIDLVKEAIGAGADEIQLDYVRFPVSGMKNIDFGLDTLRDPRAKVAVITQFVEKVHAITRARGVPLSLDVFGVIAFGKRADIQNLGQDPNELAKHCEFLSPMVYPSHYDAGFMGFDEPGAHPELVGLGVKHMLSEMDEHGIPASHAKIRPWLQAMRHNSPNYGAAYVKQEIRTGDHAGGSGWLLWNPGQIYDVAWRALPAASSKAGAAPSTRRR